MTIVSLGFLDILGNPCAYHNSVFYHAFLVDIQIFNGTVCWLQRNQGGGATIGAEAEQV